MPDNMETMKYVYGHHRSQKRIYRDLSLNYICCIPSQAMSFATYERMKQFFFTQLKKKSDFLSLVNSQRKK